VEAHTFFLYFFIILLTARLCAELAVRLGVPAVIGELCAGVLLGPSLLGWVSPAETIRLLAEIGILLLLFSVGLETDINRLLDEGKKAMLVALCGFVLPFAMGAWVSHDLFGLNLIPALFVGGTLTATSIGITVRVLSDLKRNQTIEGQVVLGAAVMDDLLGVVLLAILYQFATDNEVNVVATSQLVALMLVFFLLAPVFAKLLAVLIKRADTSSQLPGLLPTSLVMLVLFFAWMAYEMGAPELLGGFVAGLALSRRFFLPLGIALRSDPAFADRVEREMKPVVGLFTPVFFVYVGLSLNFNEIAWDSSFIWLFSLSLFVVAVLGKVLGALLLPLCWVRRWLVGIAMTPRGEVGLIFAELGRATGIFSMEVYVGLIIVIALTTLLPPLIMKWVYGRYGADLGVQHE